MYVVLPDPNTPIPNSLIWINIYILLSHPRCNILLFLVDHLNAMLKLADQYTTLSFHQKNFKFLEIFWENFPILVLSKLERWYFSKKKGNVIFAQKCPRHWNSPEGGCLNHGRAGKCHHWFISCLQTHIYFILTWRLSGLNLIKATGK